MTLYGYFRLKPKPEHIKAVERSLNNCELLTVHEIQKKLDSPLRRLSVQSATW